VSSAMNLRVLAPRSYRNTPTLVQPARSGEMNVDGECAGQDLRQSARTSGHTLPPQQLARQTVRPSVGTAHTSLQLAISRYERPIDPCGLLPTTDNRAGFPLPLVYPSCRSSTHTHTHTHTSHPGACYPNRSSLFIKQTPGCNLETGTCSLTII
jgi:hypothetical protein